MYQAHADEMRAKSRSRYRTNPEMARESTRRWRAENTSKIAEYRRNNRQSDRDHYARNADTIWEKKESHRQWCVYQITFPDGHFYIGSSGHHDLRFNAHKSLARRGKHITSLNGRDFNGSTLSVLIACETEGDALEQECQAIREALVQQDSKCLNVQSLRPSGRLYWVYVIQSEVPRSDAQGKPKPGAFYVGMTTDPARRLREHNGIYANGTSGNPKGGRYTSRSRPWVARGLYGPYGNRSEALQAEYALKRQKRGAGRIEWTTEDSKWCRGEGPTHPWVQNPARWEP